MSLKLDGFIGHEQQIGRLSALVETRELPHAFCFSGAHGLGKRKIARALFEAIAGVDLQRYPDLWTIEREINKKTKELKKQIAVEQIRDLKDQLTKTSLSQGKKLVLIKEAETLSTAAQNSLLKTLEEPRGDTLIILLASSAQSLLPTIQSRCQIIHFQPLSNESIKSFLGYHPDFIGSEASDLDLIAELSLGIPGRALDLSALSLDSDFNFIEQFLTSGVAIRFTQIADLIKKKDKHLTTRRIHLMRITLQKLLEQQTGASTSQLLTKRLTTVKTRYSAQPISKTTKALAILSDVESAISRNCSPAIALEHFALSL